MIEGGVWVGACEVAFACDLIIAAPSASFAVTRETWRALKYVRYSPFSTPVNEMAFTTKPISAERAERLGIINPFFTSCSSPPLALASSSCASDSKLLYELSALLVVALGIGII